MITAVLITYKRQYNVPFIIKLLEGISEIDEIILCDNSKSDNQYCYRRFEMALRAKNDLIYTQDDDVLNFDIPMLVKEHEQLTCGATEMYINALPHPPYSNTNLALLGFGSLFWKKDIDFSWYLDKYPKDELFLREADRIFTLLHPSRPKVIRCLIDERDELKHSMSSETRHLQDREEIINRCKQ
jgi:hypothetical protein